MSYTPLD